MTSSKLLTATPAPSDPGLEVGWDLAHYRLVPLVEELLSGNPVRDGWEAGQSVFGMRTLRATPHVKKWRQLRLGSWMRGEAFELVQVTPNLLQRIDVPACPITGLALTHTTPRVRWLLIDHVRTPKAEVATPQPSPTAQALRMPCARLPKRWPSTPGTSTPQRP